jgi:hypothetical protein
VAPYSREYNTYRQKIGRQAQGNTELEIEYEKILTRVKKTRESVIRMTDRHYTEPVDEIAGTVESASAGGITLKEYPGRRFQFSSVSRHVGAHPGREERYDQVSPSCRKHNPSRAAPEAPCLGSHAHRQPGQQLHKSGTCRLSMTHSLHRSTTTESSCRAWGHYRWRAIQWSLMVV